MRQIFVTKDSFMVKLGFGVISTPLATLSTAAILIACGGGSTPTVTTTPTSTPVLSGVVAVGAALPSVSVVVTDANGVDATVVTGSDGSYQVFDPTGVQLQAPFKLTVKTLLGTTEVSLDSFATTRDATANVTPLTTALMSLMNASGAYNAATLDINTITDAKLTAATSTLASALDPVMQAANVSPSSFNPVSGTFAANNQGIDSVMDRVTIEPTSAGLSISNRFVVLTEGQAAPAPVVVNASGVTGTLPTGITPPSADTLNGLIEKLKSCFAIDAANRVQYVVDAAGRNIYTPNSLHANCSAMVDSAYKAQGQSFGQRWLRYLSSSDFDSTTQFVLVPQYVVDRSAAGWPGDGNAYVYNINLVDKNKLAYTMPEVMAKINDQFVIRGNQRKFDISIQPMFSKLSDNVGTTNSIEGRIRIGIDPTLTPDANGVGTYAVTNSGKPLPKILCAWVTGPLLQKDETHDPNAPKGGVLMVPPHSDVTARRDYSAVRIKYPTNFDPVNNAIDKSRLFNDCKSTHNVGGNVEVASAESNSAFTIDAVKTNLASTATFRAYTALNAPVAYPTSLTRYSCPAFNAGGVQTNIASTGNVATTASTVSGWCNSTKRESMVDAALRTAFETLYKDPKDLQYTFYVFVDSAYSDTTPGTAYSAYADATDFLASAEKVNVRLVGRLPFVDKTTVSGVEIYNGAEQFRGVGQSMIDTYLKAGAASLAKNSSIAASWTIPTGAEGIDRLGISGWFRKADGSRIGQATFSDSFGLPRSLSQASFILSEDWYGYDSATYASSKFVTAPFSGAAAAAATYREIWVRSYDRSNRQIQTVEFAVR
jgi:hypothetical protein